MSQFVVLLVDDSPDSHVLAVQLLELNGYIVQSAYSGQEAVEILSQPDHVVDLVLVDVVMPDTDGLKTLENIRGFYSAAELPVILLTGRHDPRDLEASFDLGATDYLSKPLDEGLSISTIGLHLRGRRARLLGGNEIETGMTLDDKYELVEEIGSGGNGVVFRARHLELETAVALKVLRPRMFSDPKARERLRAEGQALGRIRHPNIVTVLDLQTRGPVWYLVMELLEGQNLAALIKRRAPLSPTETCRLLAPVADALDIAHHHKIIHRDIKPSNVFVHRAHAGLQVKVLDFGIAEVATERDCKVRETCVPVLSGSPRYIAPERLLEDHDESAGDIYSLGITAFEMLTHEFPYMVNPASIAGVIMGHSSGKLRRLRDIRVDIPRRLDDLIFASLSRNHLGRPTAKEFRDELDTFFKEIGQDPDRSVDIGMEEATTEPLSVSDLRRLASDN